MAGVSGSFVVVPTGAVWQRPVQLLSGNSPKESVLGVSDDVDSETAVLIAVVTSQYRASLASTASLGLI